VSVAVAALLVLVLQHWGFPALDAYLRRQKPDDAIRILRAMFIVSMSLPLAISAYLIRLGRRIRTSRQFPPPGMRVVRDTEILRGRAAVWRGNVLVGCGVVCALAAFGGAIMILRLR
jgi:hypothetical protein